ncbi:hypothetical protein Pta02_19770 [Planobispora takensis]|uniref:Uncharacterized protein n=1 Tax=Planobispora takensis TaxID=1367882 RepID=A0A8J3SSR4_9ACTN|nr:hypothetical protein Pta02_19770 [Planobispora takensis]
MADARDGSVLRTLGSADTRLCGQRGGDSGAWDAYVGDQTAKDAAERVRGITVSEKRRAARAGRAAAPASTAGTGWSASAPSTPDFRRTAGARVIRTGPAQGPGRWDAV